MKASSRVVNLAVRLTRSERAVLMRIARQRRMSVSDVVRISLNVYDGFRDASVPPPDPRQLPLPHVVEPEPPKQREKRARKPK